jgi:hypothetical protein
MDISGAFRRQMAENVHSPGLSEWHRVVAVLACKLPQCQYGN